MAAAVSVGVADRAVFRGEAVRSGQASRFRGEGSAVARTGALCGALADKQPGARQTAGGRGLEGHQREVRLLTVRAGEPEGCERDGQKIHARKTHVRYRLFGETPRNQNRKRKSYSSSLTGAKRPRTPATEKAKRNSYN